MSDIRGYPKTFVTKKGKSITIRLPRESDLNELLGYINELVDEDTTILMNKKATKKKEREYLSGILKAIKNKEGFNLLAFYEDRLVANVGMEREKYRQAHVGVLGISIRKDFRDEGIGTELLEEAIFLAKDFLKVKLLVLNTFAINERAIRLYQKVGFKKCGKWPKGVFYRGEYIDDVFMYLDLDLGLDFNNHRQNHWPAAGSGKEVLL